MSTATLSKAQKKQLRKQMVQRKQELLAKHGRSGSKARKTRSFSDIKPKLPGDPPKTATKSKLPRWTPPEPKRELHTSTPPVARVIHPHTGVTITQTNDDIVELDPVTLPGPLTRGVAAFETTCIKAVQFWKQRPWRETSAPRRADAHRGLAMIVKPLRWCAAATLIGAIAMGRISRDMGAGELGSLVVLGMGLSLAVLLFAVAEVASALRVMMRR